MPFFQESTGTNTNGGTFIDAERFRIINNFGHTKSTKRGPFYARSSSHDPLQLSTKYLLPPSVLHMIQDNPEPTATRGLDEMSSKNLRDGLTTAAANRYVGSAAPRVMENRQYRTPSLNNVIGNTDSSETSSFSEAQAIEASSVAWSQHSPISYITMVCKRRHVQLRVRLKPIHSSPPNLRHINSRN